MYCTIRKCFCRQSAQIIRNLSTGEISTALRPFYFTVHPDLFGQYPTQRTVNENSLKQLSAILESLQEKKPIRPATLPFYLRSKDEKGAKAGNFTLVKIQINDRDLRKTIHGILTTCNLPTTFIDQTKEEKDVKFGFDPNISGQQYRTGRGSMNFQDLEEDPLLAAILMRRRMKLEPDTLKAYLEKNVNEAHVKLKACSPVREEVKKLEGMLSEKLGLKNIIWDCGWNVTHYRGCLQSFKALSEQHPEFMDVLKNRVLVFANDTGIGVEGNIMLNSGEVRHNWLDLLKNVKKYDLILLRLPAFEKAVSQVLLDIQVGRRKFMPRVMVDQYENQLRQFVTSLSDYRGKKKFPKSWPESLSGYEIVIEAQAGPLMISPTGQFIVPSSCPAFLLVNFLSENFDVAMKRLHHYNNVKHVERKLHKNVLEELKLAALNKDDSITPDLMIECCERLLLHKTELRPMLEDVILWITHYYSVMSDGVLCIPWDWKL